MLSNLPAELVSHITAQLSTPDLVSCCLTSHFISLFAHQFLYRDLYISASVRNLPVVLTLAKKPHIAHHVRSFTIHIDPHAVLFKPFYDALGTALSNMSQLTSLRLFLDPAFGSALRVVHGSIFSNLLDVAFYLANTYPLLQLDLHSPTHPDSDDPELLAGSLAPPRKITGPAPDLIVPGRPLEFIRLNSGDILETVTVNLAKSTTPVVLLEANISSLSIPFLLSLSQAMPSLRYVRFTTTSINTEPPSPAFCDDVAKALSFFPALDSFELWGIHFEQTRKAPNTRGHLWKPILFCLPIDGAEPPSDLFSEDFTMY
ncbi:hypothetical protein AX17_000888 [Amanita inopinata Kibby_2008]|nr:hypothetical protein AX17_000888 [Amanita inopinata Kibby_2008]